MTSHELAQVNVARLRHPIDAPETAGFVERLEPINALADAAPGFVWRLQTEAGDATAIRPYEDDDMIMVNLSVWRDVDSLRAFTYGGDHRDVLRHRGDWFEAMGEAYIALWWVPAGHRPEPAEAIERLDVLRRHGPSADVFDLRTTFDPPAPARS